MRVEGDFIHINDWLLPLSWLYGLVVKLRNKLFDLGLLRQHSFSIPVIGVGNITVGGSGKTPHVEYLISLLQNRTKVAVLSRGYRRRTHGYQLAGKNSTAADIGDEPCQMKRKFRDIHVAVCADRCEGIRRLTTDAATRDTGVVLLDDAFQHRYVKPGINILLVDYHRLIIYDKLLPAGRLREPASGKNRADIVIVSKCPADLKPMEFRVLTKALNLFPFQELYFTTLEYGQLTQLFGGRQLRLDALRGKHVLLLTGIASPRQMMEDLKPYGARIEPMTFADHHPFSPKDVERINCHFAAMPTDRIIVTTEKDAARLEKLKGLSREVSSSLFVLPVHIKVMLGQQENFDNRILNYVMKHSPRPHKDS